MNNNISWLQRAQQEVPLQNNELIETQTRQEPNTEDFWSTFNNSDDILQDPDNKIEYLTNEWDLLKQNGYTNSNLQVKETKQKGLGVFTLQKIKNGDIVEFCHSMQMHLRQNYSFDQSVQRYALWNACLCHECKKHGPTGRIAFGNGSIYNSAELQTESNCIVEIYDRINLILFRATKDIQAGEELLIWMGENYLEQCRQYSADYEYNI
jgi:hypothetical protein